MYTLEQLEKLIPDTYKQYNITLVGANGARLLKEREYDTVGEQSTPSPCVYCKHETPNRLGLLFHPLLRLVAESNLGWPHFCNTRCLRSYIVENQVELLLSLTG